MSKISPEHARAPIPLWRDGVLVSIGGVAVASAVAGGVLWYRAHHRADKEAHLDLPEGITDKDYARTLAFIAELRNEKKPLHPHEKIVWDIIGHVVHTEPTTLLAVTEHFTQTSEDYAQSTIKRLVRNLDTFHLLVRQPFRDEMGRAIPMLVHGPLLEYIASQPEVFPETQEIAMILDERRQHLTSTEE